MINNAVACCSMGECLGALQCWGVWLSCSRRPPMQGLRVAAAAYFGVAAFFVLACFFLYALVLPRLPVIRAQQRAVRGLQHDGSDLAINPQVRCSALTSCQGCCSSAVVAQPAPVGGSVAGQQALQLAALACPTCVSRKVTAQPAQLYQLLGKPTCVNVACCCSAV